MAGKRAYLDYNASAPLWESARAAMVEALDVVGNPSSVHAEGRAARRIVEDARREVAALVGAAAANVVFTSGATEAASTLLTPDWRMGRGLVRASRLYVSAADHPCILGGGYFAPADIDVIPVDGNGLVDLDELNARLAAHDRASGIPLVAMHAANNETGVVQPVSAIAAATRAAGGVSVIDAVQAAGRIPLDITESCVDFFILSSHKIGGPKGIGAVVAASDLMMPAPLVRGGGQERGHRAGTENVPGIAGFGAAARAAREELARIEGVTAMRDRIETVLLRHEPAVEIFGRAAPRLPNTTFFALPGVKAETAQIAFDLAGVALSAGSACSSGKVGPSHVLKAMGRGDTAGALRVSVGHATSEQDLELFEQSLAALLARREKTKAA
ncbi:MAG: cysteine desulfurase [Rhizobiaceae bacterium]|nr:MAG: cysteine desulfurase [Rhizobiaceae bacterium]CAG1003095.1 cysteine desulfurase [Rhizobiaceae bacterium]